MIITTNKPYTKKEIKKLKDAKLLIGSLSNDLYRIANFINRRSYKAAERFQKETRRWARQLKNCEVKGYIKKIINDIGSSKAVNIKSQKLAEKYLMYSILLQNYVLHLKKSGIPMARIIKADKETDLDIMKFAGKLKDIDEKKMINNIYRKRKDSVIRRRKIPKI